MMKNKFRCKIEAGMGGMDNENLVKDDENIRTRFAVSKAKGFLPIRKICFYECKGVEMQLKMLLSLYIWMVSVLH
ncbi:MAG TPA: hypothetical protein PLL53_21175 [Saprospiraceae bacterium]|nr:hypothetical protein [Saprospiraceae bacterium]